jgi:glutathione S-transferase
MTTATGSSSSAKYELFYWPSIQGRGEFVRLALEAGGADYVDVARLPGDGKTGGVPELMALLDGKGGGDDEVVPPFAPPILRHLGLLLAQTANILQYLGPRLGLVPADEASRLTVHQHQLTVADLVLEAHDVHHPIGSHLYYEDQLPEAQRRSEPFVTKRVPKYLGYFERVLDRNRRAGGGAHAVGSALSYVDLSLFQLVAGLSYAFPRAMSRLRPQIPLLLALADGVAAHPPVAAYLASPRRIPFNEKGIFRHYPELDA